MKTASRLLDIVRSGSAGIPIGRYIRYICSHYRVALQVSLGQPYASRSRHLTASWRTLTSSVLTTSLPHHYSLEDLSDMTFRWLDEGTTWYRTAARPASTMATSTATAREAYAKQARPFPCISLPVITSSVKPLHAFRSAVSSSGLSNGGL
jgi:hypothetical protein